MTSGINENQIIQYQKPGQIGQTVQVQSAAQIQNATVDPALGAHYSTQTKIKVPSHVVVNGPQSVPEHHIYNDFEANAKLSAIHNDIFEQTQKVPKPKRKKRFLGLF